ncbi:hypothetical protein [Sphingopyxis sp.]|uniref:hypothetical protein n=1 Tax=Sphingopyxis sp. TaxID=1908224 RepID=UPI003D0A5223
MKPIATGLALFLLALPHGAIAQGAPESVPLYGRILTFTLPADMVRANDQDNGTNRLIEYTPRGETVANWTRLVTIQAYRGLGASPLPTAQIARQAFYPAACKVGPIYQDNGEKALAGGVMRSLILNGCASLPPGAYPEALAGAGEQDFILIFRDADTIYTLNYAVRGKTFAGKAPPVALGKAEALLKDVFGEIKLAPAQP